MHKYIMTPVKLMPLTIFNIAIIEKPFLNAIKYTPGMTTELH